MLKITLGFLAICTIWGTTWLAITWGYETFPPLLGSSVRFLLASLIYLPWVTYRRERFPENRREWQVVLVLGILGFGLAYGLVYIGQQYIPSALSSILFSTYPFWVAIGSYAVLKETRFTVVKVAGIIIGFIGILLIFGHQLTGFDPGYFAGMVLIVVSAAVQALNLILIRKWGINLSASVLNFLGMGFGGLFLLVWSFLTETWQVNLTAAGLLSTFYLTVVGSVIVFGIYWWLLSQVQAVTLSLSAFLTPVVAVVAGYLFAGEVLSFWVYLGGLVAISGVLLYNLGDLLTGIQKRK
ncbi:MAG: EamA family transporter [Bacteroidetes bacterium]|nr:EamA family transporter [Bacteroidota bacterium]